MQKVRLIVHSEDASPAFEALQKLGAISLREVPRDMAESLTRAPAEEFPFHYESARVEAALAFLHPYADEGGTLAAMVEGTKERITEDDVKQAMKSLESLEGVEEALSVQKSLNDSQKALRSLRKEYAQLEPWKVVPIAQRAAASTASTRTVWVLRERVPRDDSSHRALAQALRSADMAAHIVRVDAQRAVVTVYASEDAAMEHLRSVLKSLSYEDVSLPSPEETPLRACKRITRAIRETEAEMKRLQARARTLAAQVPSLKILSDVLLWKRQQHDVERAAYRTQQTMVYDGWIPRAALDHVRTAVEAVAPAAAVIPIDPEPGEEPPVEIANGPAVRPFEVITRLYGLPGARDVDPTPYLAGFFFVFFGFCLTDVGYGAILAILTGYILYRYRVSESLKPMLQLLFLGGIASLLAGLFFGGYFGVSMEQMPEPLRAIQVFDPIANPIPVFLFALALGVIQVMAGLCVAIIRGVRTGDPWGAVADNGPWLALFISLIVFGATRAGILSVPHVEMAIYASVVAIILTQGRRESSLFMKFFKGVTSLYDSVSYFADILSYSRLLALGLATSALAFAINLIAGMVAGPEGERTIVGMIFAGVVLVVGHLFNLAINAFGAFIHSARLQFVEFFGKFLVGTGTPFVPFERTARHTVLTEDRVRLD